jgi:hypothetical protein
MPENIRCPYCEGEISKTAKKCCHCGEWIIKPSEPVRLENSGKGEGCFLQTMNCGCQLIFLFILLVVILVTIGTCYGNN